MSANRVLTTGKVSKALLYTGLGGAVHWVCQKAGHSLAPHELTGIVAAIAAVGENLIHASEHLSVHVIGERIGHALFHSDQQHPTATGLNRDIERVLARAAARTIGRLMTEWERLPMEHRTCGKDQWELDDLRTACTTFLQNKTDLTTPECITDWLAKLDQSDILEHSGLEAAPWTRPEPLPPQPCKFVEFFDWRFPAEFKHCFADEIANDAVAHAKFVLILNERTLTLLGSNAAGIAAIQSQLTALSTSLSDPNALWISLVADRTATRVLQELTPVLAAQGRNPNDLSREELTRELASRVHDFTAETLERLIEYARFKADITRIGKYAPTELIGRDSELELLSDAWAKACRDEAHRPHVLTFVALGGEGKTSLVAKWVASLADDKWPGCDAVFAWSFYSQGTREQLAASSDLFLKEALTFFGDDADKEFADSPASAFEKGQRLARIVGQRRSLLILDGLEPLQYAPTSPTPGQLKDQGIAALLRALAAASHGLCVVTTRYSLPDLKAFWQTTAPEMKLLRLSRDAGVHLLKTLGVRGAAQEFATLVEDVKGHALTLTLLGGFLKRAFHGDIRQRDRVKFEKADEKMDGGHAFRTMAAYEQWLLRDGGDEGRREVAVLRLMGLFDRAADAGCLAALRKKGIRGLNEPIAKLADDDWQFCLSGLEDAKLLTVNRDATGVLVSLDAHPLLREYFARQLRTEQPDAWRTAHRRLYEHLCASTPDKPQPTLEDLQPLYQAVAHGCLAGLPQETADSVYRARILRTTEQYSFYQLGAFGSDLGAIAGFFELPWKRISPALAETSQAWLFAQSAFCLRALGRLTEALDPMRAGVKMSVTQQNWEQAAIHSSNLSALELTLGQVAGAVVDAELSVTYADRSGDPFQRLARRAAYADVLHQSGRRAEAETLFRKAEQMRAEPPSNYSLLFCLGGFNYCDLLLAPTERATWQICVGADGSPPQTSPASLGASKPADGGGHQTAATTLLDSCRAVSQRAAQTLKYHECGDGRSHLHIALDHLTLGRAALYVATLGSLISHRPTASSELTAAVDGLRRAGTMHHIPRGLLTRAWLRFLTGARTGPESAQKDLDEAWEIAERGPMKLFLADIHLYRARLFLREKLYPWKSPQDDLAAAEKLINACGYHRRDEELADAKQAILGS